MVGSKNRVKSFIAPDLRKRVDFHVTSYRRSHDEAEEAWLTIDGEIAFVASWYRHQWAGALYTGKGTMARDGRNRPMHDPALPDINEPEELELHRKAISDRKGQTPQNGTFGVIDAVSPYPTYRSHSI